MAPEHAAAARRGTGSPGAVRKSDRQGRACASAMLSGGQARVDIWKCSPCVWRLAFWGAPFRGGRGPEAAAVTLAAATNRRLSYRTASCVKESAAIPVRPAPVPPARRLARCASSSLPRCIASSEQVARLHQQLQFARRPPAAAGGAAAPAVRSRHGRCARGGAGCARRSSQGDDGVGIAQARDFGQPGRPASACRGRAACRSSAQKNGPVRQRQRRAAAPGRSPAGVNHRSAWRASSQARAVQQVGRRAACAGAPATDARLRDGSPRSAAARSAQAASQRPSAGIARRLRARSASTWPRSAPAGSAAHSGRASASMPGAALGAGPGPGPRPACSISWRDSGTASATSASKAATPVRAHEGVGVVLGRQEQEAHAAQVGGVRQRGLQRAPGGAAAGGVAVEAEDHRVGVAEQLVHMVGGAGRAERGHGIAAGRTGPAPRRPCSPRRPARSPCSRSAWRASNRP